MLALDDSDFAGPDGFFELVDICVADVVKIDAGNGCTELVRANLYWLH